MPIHQHIHEGDETLKETYDKFVKEATTIKEMTSGRINMFETGESLHRAGVKLFLSYNKSIHPEEILPDEAEWIKNASSGPLVWSEDVYKPDESIYMKSIKLY
ncbi:hypothetical protein DLAC_01391 [Tieghemostelium lacteum]|uniref:Uncharacterized protein n=1 Tax=Tieghemostelium lacteum TaxID=361077 RepID=A0A152A8T8_TIELA|nr:hypothetical protein DLAC_01391 [Tieghemostelium lacteum]|eukprot:KYR02545.1 hypothetical protein DLAC_01391 [Tieghemostelium lacteum]